MKEQELYEEALKFCYNLTVPLPEALLEEPRKQDALRKYYTEPFFHAAVKHVTNMYIRLYQLDETVELKAAYIFLLNQPNVLHRDT